MERIQSVDVFRLVAIVAVIIIHTTPFYLDMSDGGKSYGITFVVIDQFSRFAVPFFFAISGYFWGAKTRENGIESASALMATKRVGIILLAWSFIYLLPYNISSIVDYGILGPIKVVYWDVLNLAGHPLRTLMQGSKEHLWFLVGLLFAVNISAFLIKRKLLKTLISISVILYFVGVAAKAYIDTPIGIELNFNTRNGPFMSLLLFVSGYILSGIPNSSRWAIIGVFVFLVGSGIQFLELYVLSRYFETTMIQDYVFGTYFMGLGVALIALSNHRKFRISFLGKIGTMTLGIYAVHLIFVDLLRPVDARTDNIFWEIAYIFLVFGFSIISVIFLSRFKLTRQIVV